MRFLLIFSIFLIGCSKEEDVVFNNPYQLLTAWKGKGYGPEGEEGITHKNDGKGNLIAIDKSGDTQKAEPEPETKLTKIEKNPMDKTKGDKKDTETKDTEPQTPSDVQRDKKFGKTYSEPLTTTDEQFNQKNRNNKTTSTYTLPDSITNNPKIPKKYTQLLERMLNTKRNTDDGTETSDYYGLEGVGAGNLEANIGELMTLYWNYKGEVKAGKPHGEGGKDFKEIIEEYQSL